MSIESFNLLLLVMGLMALVVFIALYFVRAGYGMFRSRSWGISVNNKIAWILMKLLSFWLWDGCGGIPTDVFYLSNSLSFFFSNYITSKGLLFFLS